MTLLVLGVGNAGRGDDAAGLEVARRVGAAGIRAVELGEPIALLDAWDGASEVIVVDAVRSGAEPGTVHRLDARAGPLPARRFQASTHHVSVAGVVELGRSLGRLPDRLEVYGIEGGRFEAGNVLVPAVRRAVEEVATGLTRRRDRQGADDCPQ